MAKIVKRVLFFILLLSCLENEKIYIILPKKIFIGPSYFLALFALLWHLFPQIVKYTQFISLGIGIAPVFPALSCL